jgi:thioredoxin 1
MAFTTINKLPIMNVPIPENVIIEMSKEEFAKQLAYNQGALVIKFGAEWCGPCKQIASLVNSRMAQFPETIKGAVIDIDDNFDIYALLKSKRVVNGVPVILCYKKGNLTVVPDNVVVGADVAQINAFFDTCMTYA